MHVSTPEDCATKKAVVDWSRPFTPILAHNWGVPAELWRLIAVLAPQYNRYSRVVMTKYGLQT
jgi:hypothetical protein